MKCDELKAETIVPQGTAITLQMYPKGEVDEAIDELKREHHRERDEYIDFVNKLQKENAELKGELKNVKCNHFRSLPTKTAMEWSDLWESIETKCRAKAEQYK